MHSSPGSEEQRQSSHITTRASSGPAKQSTTAKKDSHPNDSNTPKVKSFLSLPWKLIQRIIRSLEPVSTQCLRYSCTRLHAIGQSDTESFTRCERWLISTRLEQDLLNSLVSRASTPKLPRRSLRNPFKTKSKGSLPEKPSRLNCALCKIKHPPTQFLKGSGALGLLYNKESELLSSKSLQRLCALQIRKTVLRPTSSVIPFNSRWVSYLRAMCLHCGQTIEVDDCPCAGTRDKPPVCEVCPNVNVRWHVRIPRKGEPELISCEFKNASDGTLYVLETFCEYPK